MTTQQHQVSTCLPSVCAHWTWSEVPEGWACQGNSDKSSDNLFSNGFMIICSDSDAKWNKVFNLYPYNHQTHVKLDILILGLETHPLLQFS